MHENLLSNNIELIKKSETDDNKNYNDLNDFEELVKTELGYKKSSENIETIVKKNNSFIESHNTEKKNTINCFKNDCEKIENESEITNKFNSNSISSTSNTMKLEIMNKFSELNKGKKST